MPAKPSKKELMDKKARQMAAEQLTGKHPDQFESLRKENLQSLESLKKGEGG